MPCLENEPYASVGFNHLAQCPPLTLRFLPPTPGYSLLPALQQRKSKYFYMSLLCSLQGSGGRQRVMGKEDKTTGLNKLGDFFDFLLNSKSLTSGATCT